MMMCVHFLQFLIFGAMGPLFMNEDPSFEHIDLHAVIRNQEEYRMMEHYLFIWYENEKKSMSEIDDRIELLEREMDKLDLPKYRIKAIRRKMESLKSEREWISSEAFTEFSRKLIEQKKETEKKVMMTIRLYCADHGVEKLLYLTDSEILLVRKGKARKFRNITQAIIDLVNESVRKTHASF